jgi:phosphoribosylformimino-5-aminoimidazole carboxamide ribotide isomerase
MLAIPSVDVLDGRIVRLLRGDFDQVTDYGDDPLPTITKYVEAGARRIHLVDLDGARYGTTSLELVQRVAAVVPDLQVGGGIRTATRAVAALDAGAARVVVGSLAVHDPDELSRLVATVGSDRVVVAVDVRDGMARGSGWTDRGVPAGTTIQRALSTGVESLLVTGVERDGTLGGPDLDLLVDVRSLAPNTEIIASGGVGALNDLDAAGAHGADAAVVGKALLEEVFTIGELMARFGHDV